MRQRLVSLCLVAGLACAGHVSASGFGLFQHGGRAIGQVGAFTARGSEPSAVYYNPAAITRLEGFQVQAGLDFSNSTDKYESSTGEFSARHIIDFPPALYATWRSGGPWALGIGLDVPFWYRTDWDPALFPARFRAREHEVRVAEIHPVIAYDLGEGWSVGGGVRYIFGNLTQGNSALRTVQYIPPSGPSSLVEIEIERTADADVDALAWDLALHYEAPEWGWGTVFRSNAELKGNGKATYDPRSTGIPSLDAQAEQFFRDGRARQAFEIPRELRGGIWYAPYPELRLEVDASWQSWSSLEETAVTWSPDPVIGTTSATYLTPRDWDDTLSLRLGLEGNITDPLMIYGGVAWEPSPVPGGTLEPGFPRGDALVYAAGVSYSLPNISFDLGYSFHDHDSRGASGQELKNPGVNGSYSAFSQVWGFSVRRRW